MNTRKIKLGVYTLFATSAILAGSIAAAPSASATQWCTGDYPDQWSLNNRTIVLPGKPDIIVTEVLCFYNETGFYQVVGHLSWASTTGGNGFGTKFNNFRQTVWLQQSAKKKCSSTSYPDVNPHASGTYTWGCVWKHADTSKMSADGQVVYDVANDGKKAYTWNLKKTAS